MVLPRTVMVLWSFLVLLSVFAFGCGLLAGRFLWAPGQGRGAGEPRRRGRSEGAARLTNKPFSFPKPIYPKLRTASTCRPAARLREFLRRGRQPDCNVRRGAKYKRVRYPAELPLSILPA